jgi:Tn3 transposase DDE domain
VPNCASGSGEHEQVRGVPPLAKWLFFGGEGLLLEIHPDDQEKWLKYNHLLTNAVAIHKVRVVRDVEKSDPLVRAMRGVERSGARVCCQ